MKKKWIIKKEYIINAGKSNPGRSDEFVRNREKFKISSFIKQLRNCLAHGRIDSIATKDPDGNFIVEKIKFVDNYKDNTFDCEIPINEYRKFILQVAQHYLTTQEIPPVPNKIVTEIDSLIQRLDTWLKENRSDYYAALNPGATDEDFVNLEAALNNKLPEDFKSLYRWRNGERIDQESDISLLPYREFISIDEIVKEIQNKFGLIEIGFWSAGYIPFIHDSSGDYFCIDTQGNLEGIPGQVIYWCHDDQTYGKSVNLTKWLEAYCIACETAPWDTEEWDELFRKLQGKEN
jgi:cell wall assembly regulator SMI1